MSDAEVGSRLIQDVLKMKPGDQLMIEARPIYENFKVNHNPQKGETMLSELDRWLHFIRNNHDIVSNQDPNNECFYFMKLKPFSG